jgi:hypothetical protein
MEFSKPMMNLTIGDLFHAKPQSTPRKNHRDHRGCAVHFLGLKKP